MTQVVASSTNNIVKVYSVGVQGATGPSGSLQSSNSGSFSITGSLIVSGSNTFTNIGPSILSGSVTSTGGFTGSLAGTASYASFALTASYAVSASYEIIKEESSSYADTASIAILAYTASYINPTFISASAASSGFGVTTSTGSLMITGSAINNILTFTKGDGSTFNLTVATGSAVTTSTSSLMVTGSVSSNTLTFTKGDGSTFNLTVDTGSAITTPTSSLMVTGSVSSNTLTFTKGDGSTFNLTVATGSGAASTFPYSGTAQITGSLEILTTSFGYPIITTGDDGIKLIRSSSAFGYPGNTWGGYIYPLTSILIYNQAGGILGGTKNPFALLPLSTAQDVALMTVTYGANVFISASNEIYLGYGSTTPSKTFIRDTAIVNGSLTISGSTTSTGGFTGSLAGTSSFAITASFVSGAALLNSANTFTQATIFSGSIRGEVNALTISSNTASLNCALDNFYTLQLVSGSNTFINPSNILPGQTINLRVNTTGSATVSFPSLVKQVSGSAYVPTTTTGVDVVTFISFDSSSLLLSNVKNLV